MGYWLLLSGRACYCVLLMATLVRWSESGVYFFRAGSLVKIGCSRILSSRIEALRHNFGGDLFAVEPCLPHEIYAAERRRHRQFARFRQHDEWFTWRPVYRVISQEME